jgi:hypothetical protein
MSKNIVNPKRQCPGDGYEISISICKGRQRVHYPKCPVCHYRTEAVNASSTSVEEDTEKTNQRPVTQGRLYNCLLTRTKQSISRYLKVMT